MSTYTCKFAVLINLILKDMIGFAFFAALVASIFIGIAMSSDSSRMGHTYASQNANSKVVAEVSVFVFAVVFFGIMFIAFSLDT